MPPVKRTYFGRNDKGKIVGNGGFAGGVISPTNVGDGWPRSDNAWLTSTGDAVCAVPGHKRTLPHCLEEATDANYLHVKLFDPKQAYEATRGAGIAVTDGYNGRIMGLSYNPTAAQFTSAGTPKMVATMTRQHAWEFPSIVEMQGKAHIIKERDPGVVYDGAIAREWGIRAPSIKPVVSPVVSTGPAATDTVALVEASSSSWTSSQTAVTASNSNAVPLSSYGSANYSTLSLLYSTQAGSERSPTAGLLAVRDIGSTINITAPTKFIRARIYVSDFMTEGSFSLSLYTGTGGGGTEYELAITQPIVKNTWTDLNLPWDQAGTVGVQSVGLKKTSPGIPATSIRWVDILGYSVGTLSIRINGIQSVIPATAPDEDSQEYVFCHTYWDSARLMESNPSPASDVVKMSPGSRFTYDASGYVTTFTASGAAGRVNLPPSLVSLSDSRWEWIAGANGASNYYLRSTNSARYPRVFFKPASVWISGVKAEEGTLGALTAGQWAYGDNDSLGYDTVYIRTSGSADPDSLGTHAVMAYMQGVDAIKIYVHRLIWGNDPTTNDRVWRLVSDPFKGTPLITTTTSASTPIPASGTNYKMEFVIEGLDEDVVFASRGLSFFNEKPPAAKFAAQHGDRIVFAGQDDYSVGAIDIASDNVTISPTSDTAANTPVFGKWMEGRKIRFGNEADTYTIAQVFSSTVYGAPDRAIIGKDWDPETGSYRTAYQGTYGNGKTYRIIGEPNRIWWTARTNSEDSGRGSYTEGMNLNDNAMDLEMQGEPITGIGFVGEDLLVFGSRLVYLLIQDKTAVDDFGQPAYAQPHLLHGWPGTTANRSIVPMPGGAVCYISSAGRVIYGTTGGFNEIPLSNNIEEWIKTSGDVDPNHFKDTFGFYHPQHNMPIFHFPNTAATVTNDETSTITAVSDTSFYDLTTETSLFGPTLAVDVENSRCFIMSDMPFTAALSLASDAVREGQVPLKAYCGMESGFIHKAYEADAYSFGHRGPCISYTVAASPSPTSSGFTVNIDGDHPNLPTTGDAMKRIPIRHTLASTGVSYEYTIASSSANALSFAAASLSPVPVAGDTIEIAPIDVYFELREEHFTRLVTVQNAIFDAHEDAGITGSYVLSVYGPSGRGIEVDDSTPLVTETLTLDKAFRYARGIPLRKVGMLAQRVRLAWTQQFGRQEIRRLDLINDVKEGEQYRS